MNLESELRALAVDWPETPRFALAQRRRRWPLAVAIVAAAIAAAFAVPQSRGAILRFFHIGGATVRIVDRLPRAEERPLASGLGPVVTRARARTIVHLLVPPLTPAPRLHRSQGNVISVVFRSDGQPVVLSEFAGAYFLKKLALEGTGIEYVRVRGLEGAWLSGPKHVVVFPAATARLAGNVLIWADETTTYRLEGPKLTKLGALRIAASLRRG